MQQFWRFWRLFLLGFGLFEASLLVQFLQLFLLSNENNPVLSSDSACLELASRAVAQEWMNVSHLAEKVLSLCFICYVFSTDLHAAQVDLQRLCTVSCVAHSIELEDQKIFVPSLLLCLF